MSCLDEGILGTLLTHSQAKVDEVALKAYEDEHERVEQVLEGY
jgi:hypothetical protein